MHAICDSNMWLGYSIHPNTPQIIQRRSSDVDDHSLQQIVSLQALISGQISSGNGAVDSPSQTINSNLTFVLKQPAIPSARAPGLISEKIPIIVEPFLICLSSRIHRYHMFCSVLCVHISFRGYAAHGLGLPRGASIFVPGITSAFQLVDL